MKVISIWQPYASLLVHRHKLFETRSWAAPKSLIGQRIGIAATKIISPEQRALCQNPEFQQVYAATGLEQLEQLPLGCIVGSAVLNSCEVMTEDFIEDVTDEEQLFGVWEPGRYAWRMRDPVAFQIPLLARGQQGIWSFDEHNVLLPAI